MTSGKDITNIWNQTGGKVPEHVAFKDTEENAFVVEKPKIYKSTISHMSIWDLKEMTNLSVYAMNAING